MHAAILAGYDKKAKNRLERIFYNVEYFSGPKFLYNLKGKPILSYVLNFVKKAKNRGLIRDYVVVSDKTIEGMGLLNEKEKIIQQGRNLIENCKLAFDYFKTNRLVFIAADSPFLKLEDLERILKKTKEAAIVWPYVREKEVEDFFSMVKVECNRKYHKGLVFEIGGKIERIRPTGGIVFVDKSKLKNKDIVEKGINWKKVKMPNVQFEIFKTLFSVLDKNDAKDGLRAFFSNFFPLRPISLRRAKDILSKILGKIELCNISPWSWFDVDSDEDLKIAEFLCFFA